jgi:hypothetical protein
MVKHLMMKQNGKKIDTRGMQETNCVYVDGIQQKTLAWHR